MHPTTKTKAKVLYNIILFVREITLYQWPPRLYPSILPGTGWTAITTAVGPEWGLSVALRLGWHLRSLHHRVWYVWKAFFKRKVIVFLEFTYLHTVIIIWRNCYCARIHSSVQLRTRPVNAITRQQTICARRACLAWRRARGGRGAGLPCTAIRPPLLDTLLWFFSLVFFKRTSPQLRHVNWDLSRNEDASVHILGLSRLLITESSTILRYLFPTCVARQRWRATNVHRPAGPIKGMYFLRFYTKADN